MHSDGTTANHYEGGGQNLNLFESNAPPETRGFPGLRAFQTATNIELRRGHTKTQKQIVMAPTGAGKTLLALHVCAEALARGGRVVFICDRKTLINQTSAVADAYGMPPH